MLNTGCGANVRSKLHHCQDVSVQLATATRLECHLRSPYRLLCGPSGATHLPLSMNATRIVMHCAYKAINLETSLDHLDALHDNKLIQIDVIHTLVFFSSLSAP